MRKRVQLIWSHFEQIVPSFNQTACVWTVECVLTKMRNVSHRNGNLTFTPPAVPAMLAIQIAYKIVEFFLTDFVGIASNELATDGGCGPDDRHRAAATDRPARARRGKCKRKLGFRALRV